MSINHDDLYARNAERFFGLQPRVDDDEIVDRRFADLAPAEQPVVVAEFVRKFGMQHLTDALCDLAEDSLLQAYELGDGATGSLVRRCITQALAPAIDRAVADGKFELED